MHRFFVQVPIHPDQTLVLPSETARQIHLVLRLRPGEKVLLLDGKGWEYPLELTRVEKEGVEGRALAGRRSPNEPQVAVHLYLGLTQREKFEWMLQKCTELGAAAFTPVIRSRSLVQDQKGAEGKYPRWQKILQEAAEQSGRGMIPNLQPILRFNQAVIQAQTQTERALFFWEEEQALGLRQALSAGQEFHRVALFIGPEGGYSAEEAALAREHGLLPVSLGKRILRMETAAVTATALALYQLGEMDAPEPIPGDAGANSLTSRE
jgi:16S rRNA (uracil1498-N3)-methyltransferase